MSFPGGDNRTVWQLAFSEQGLDPIITKASAAEKQFDRIVATAVKAGAAVGTFGSSSVLQPMTNAELKAKNLSDQLAASNRTLQTFSQAGGAALQTFASAAAIALGAVVAGATAAGYALSQLDEKATKAFGERTSTIRAYTTILGDAKQAQIEYAKANELASKTEFSTASAVAAQQQLIVAGFRGKDLDAALLSVADVTAAAAPKDRELTSERIGRAFAQILAAGKLRGQELNQLAEAGVGRGAVLDALGPDRAASEKRISSGGVSAQEGIAAVQKAILAQFNTQQLGQFATGASGSLSGLLSNREEALDILLKSFDGETTPAVIRYKDALAEQTVALSTSSETGRGMVMMLSDFAGVTANVKSIWTDFSTSFLETFVDSYNESRQGEQAFVAMTDGVKTLGKTLGQVGSVVGTLADGFESLMDALEPVGAYLSQFIGAFSEMIGHFGTALSELNQGNLSNALDENKKAFSSFAGAFDPIEFDEDGINGRGARRAEARNRARAASDAVDEAAGPIADRAVTTKWGKSGSGKSGGKGKLAGGYDITSLLMGGSGGSGGSGEGSGSSQGLAERMNAAVGAAAAVSSAPSAQAQRDAAASASGASAAPMSVTIAAGAIVVNGVSDPMAAAQEAYRLLGQTLGRIGRAPGAGTL